MPSSTIATRWLLGDGSWPSHRAVLRLQVPYNSNSDDKWSLLLDWQDADNYARLTRRKYTTPDNQVKDRWYFQRVENGTSTEPIVAAEATTAAWLTIDAVMVAGVIRVAVEDMPVYYGVAMAYAGRFGLEVMADAGLVCRGYEIEPATPVMAATAITGATAKAIESATPGSWFTGASNYPQGVLVLSAQFRDASSDKLTIKFEPKDSTKAILEQWVLQLGLSNSGPGCSLKSPKGTARWEHYLAAGHHDIALAWSTTAGLTLWIDSHEVLSVPELTVSPGYVSADLDPPIENDPPPFVSQIRVLSQAAITQATLFEDAFRWFPSSDWLTIPDTAWTFEDGIWTGTAGAAVPAVASVGAATWPASRVTLQVMQPAAQTAVALTLGDSNAMWVKAMLTWGQSGCTVELHSASGKGQVMTAIGLVARLDGTPQMRVDLEAVGGLVRCWVAGVEVASMAIDNSGAESDETGGPMQIAVLSGSLQLVRVAVVPATWHDLAELPDSLNDHIGEAQLYGRNKVERIGARWVQTSEDRAWPDRGGRWFRARNAVDADVHRSFITMAAPQAMTYEVARSRDGSVMCFALPPKNAEVNPESHLEPTVMLSYDHGDVPLADRRFLAGTPLLGQVGVEMAGITVLLDDVVEG